MRYWAIAICVLQFFVNQAVTSKLSKLTYLSNQAVFSTCPKSQDKNLNILRTKRVFTMKWKTFSIIFEELSLKQIKTKYLSSVNHELIHLWWIHMILGQLPPRKIAANAKINPNPYPKANWGGNFRRGRFSGYRLIYHPRALKNLKTITLYYHF